MIWNVFGLIFYQKIVIAIKKSLKAVKLWETKLEGKVESFPLRVWSNLMVCVCIIKQAMLQTAQCPLVVTILFMVILFDFVVSGILFRQSIVIFMMKLLVLQNHCRRMILESQI